MLPPWNKHIADHVEKVQTETFQQRQAPEGEGSSGQLARGSQGDDGEVECICQQY